MGLSDGQIATGNRRLNLDSGGKVEKGQTKVSAPGCLALNQCLDFGSDIGFVQSPEPTSHDLSLRIDKQILRLRGDTKLASDIIQCSVVDIKNDPLNPVCKGLLESAHGGPICATGRSPRCPRIVKLETRRNRLRDNLTG